MSLKSLSIFGLDLFKCQNGWHVQHPAHKSPPLTPGSLTHFLCITESPGDLEISDKAEELEIGKLTKVGFSMINITFTYIIFGSKPWREIPS